MSQPTPAQQAAANAQTKLSQAADTIAHHPVVQQGTDVARSQLNALDRELAKYGFLNDFEAKTHIPKTYGVLGLSVTFAILILLNLFGLASPVTNAIGFFLPAYLSCAALESPGKGDDVQWLTYWIVFGLFNFLESAMLRLVLYYFPYYFTFKLAAVIYLMLPATRGAEKIYNMIVKPIFLAGRSKVRQAQSSASSTQSTSNFSSAGTTQAPSSSTGYSTSNNPFVSNSGLHSTSAGLHAGEVPVPVAAGVPLPDTL